MSKLGLLGAVKGAVVFCCQNVASSDCIERVLRLNNRDYIQVSNLRAASELALSPPIELFIASASLFSEDSLYLIPSCIKEAKRILLISDDNSSGIRLLDHLNNIDTILGDNSICFERDFSALLQKSAPKGFLIHDVLKYPAFLKQTNVQNYGDRDTHLNQLEEAAARTSCFASFSKFVTMCGWELMMNAIFDVTYEIADSPSTYHVRSENIVLGINEEVILSFGFDEKIFAVSVKDGFGSLDIDKIRHLLAGFYRRQVDVNIAGEGGAGIGLFMVLTYANALHFCVKPGVSTEIVAVFYRSRRVKTYKSQIKTLNFIKTGKETNDSLES